MHVVAVDLRSLRRLDGKAFALESGFGNILSKFAWSEPFWLIMLDTEPSFCPILNPPSGQLGFARGAALVHDSAVASCRRTSLMGGGRDEQSVYPFYKVNIHEAFPTMFLGTVPAWRGMCGFAGTGGCTCSTELALPRLHDYCS